jgi:hypothetical protein
VTRCFGCRPRPSRATQAPTDFGNLFNTTFNPLINSLQSNPSTRQSHPLQVDCATFGKGLLVRSSGANQ